MNSGMLANGKALRPDLVVQRKGEEMKWWMAGLLALVLSGCGTRPIDAEEEMYGASVGIVNHTGKYVYSAGVNGAGGSNMDEYGAGGAEVCCAMIPEKWRPGLKARVRVTFAVGRKLTGLEKTVEVERYDTPGSIYIHLFPDDQVRLVVSEYPGYSSGHPIPRPVKPAGWTRPE